MKSPSRWFSSKLVNVLFLLFIYLLAAGAGLNGFVTKYGFHDMPDSTEAVQRYSFSRMIDQTADRPFVYRQLLPMIARGLQNTMSPDRRAAVNERVEKALQGNWSLAHTFDRSSASQARYALDYLVVYSLTFISFFAGLLLLRSVCLTLTGSPAAATLAPLAFAALFPILMSKNGYFYDFPEVMFMALGAWLALRDRWIWLAVVTAIATLNKETYFLFALALMPFMLHGRPRLRDGLKAAVIVLAGVAMNLIVKAHYAGSPGTPIELHIQDNLHFYLNPLSYLRLAINYGVVTPNEFNLVNIVLVAALVARGWPVMSKPMRQHILICAVINFPLFFLFCAPEELRNLSMMYVSLVMLFAVGLRRWIKSESGSTLPIGASVPRI
jgi:hypothetical protein